MKHICYIYIFKYRILRNIGVAFNPSYEYVMNGNKLAISTNKDSIPKYFWGEHIYSLSAIVGENGVGKSTLLDVLFNICVEGAASQDTDALIVYEEDGNIKAYIPQGKNITITYNGVDIEGPSLQPKIYSTYYSGYFSPYFSYNYPRDIELTGSFNMSDGYLLLKDLQDYADIDTLHLTERIGSHYQAHIAQDNFRIACLLSDMKIRQSLKKYELPKFLTIVPNKSGIYNVNKWIQKENIDIKILAYNRPLLPNEQGALYELIYYNMVNLIAESRNKIGILYLNKWGETYNKNQEVLPQLQNYALNQVKDPYYQKCYLDIFYILKEMYGICQYSESYGCFFINVENNPESIKEWMLRVYKNSHYIVAKYFDVGYSRDENPQMRLSTGELVVLKLFSRLYHVLRLEYNKASNLGVARLLLLDEAEIGFHPDWQRMFISNLVEFINSLVQEGEDPVQIIMTTHSPFILSDMPSDCVTYLKKRKSENGEIIPSVADSKSIKSFGANLYDLLKNGYFLSCSIGEFAQKKIHKLYEIYNIEDERTKKNQFVRSYEELKYVIRSISDPFIANDAERKFIEMGQRYCKEELKAMLEREIEEKTNLLSKL